MTEKIAHLSDFFVYVNNFYYLCGLVMMQKINYDYISPYNRILL